MRMRARTPVALAMAAAVALLAGCGPAGGVRTAPSGATAGSSSPRPTGTSSSTSPTSPASPACGDVVLTPSGTDREVCVGVGRTLRLRLGQGDQPATEHGAALTSVSPGVYRGARTGSAELSGFRRSCPSAKPGGFSCHAIAGWRVTVRVR
jgi:hypothetical protein